MATLRTAIDTGEGAGIAVYRELIDLLIQGNGPEAIIAFRSSDEQQDRAYALLEKKRSGTLSALEEQELRHIGEREHLLRLAKIRARQILKERSPQSTTIDK